MRYKKIAAVLAGGFVLCVAIYLAYSWAYPNIEEGRLYVVDKVIDGDTLDLKARLSVFRVRLLGLDTPETVDPRRPAQCYGQEASATAVELVEGRLVRVEFNPNRERLDRYGRYLAYLHREDGLFLNGYMLENGLAREYTYGKAYSRQAEFRALERAAQKSKKGLWGACDDIVDTW